VSDEASEGGASWVFCPVAPRAALALALARSFSRFLILLFLFASF